MSNFNLFEQKYPYARTINNTLHFTLVSSFSSSLTELPNKVAQNVLILINSK